jgi:hypothetical protein
MNWDAIGATGEVLGAMVVLATVLYLAQQIKQSVNLARASQNMSLMDAYGEFNSQITGNQDVAELMVTFQQEPESLSEREAVQLRHLAFRYGNIVIGAELAYSQGQITKEQFQLYQEDVSVMTELYPGLRAKLIENYNVYPAFREMDIWKRIIAEHN